MRILWLCNIIMPSVACTLGVNAPSTGGWLTGISSELVKLNDCYLGVCFPYHEYVTGKTDSMEYFGLNVTNEDQFRNIIDKFSPDIIHIFGTEFKHSYDMVCAAEKCGVLDKVVVSIQGLVSVYAFYYYYYANLPWRVVHRHSLRDFLKQNSIKQQRDEFEKRGVWEIKTLKKVKHVIGRTEWDRACVERINPMVNYHHCNETLRPAFYDNAGTWSIDKCEKHSIFVSQCGYPIKGFHYMLEAMADIVKVFPDAHLYTTGSSPLHMGVKQRIRRSSYAKYIGELIKKYKLQDHVTFLGVLNEQQMCERFLKSNVFVSASTIENSPNSVGEAMLLGVPVVTSDVGGVRNMITDLSEGYMYPADEPYMCAFYVKKVFDSKELSFARAATEHAKKTHDRKANCLQLTNIYEDI